MKALIVLVLVFGAIAVFGGGLLGGGKGTPPAGAPSATVTAAATAGVPAPPSAASGGPPPSAASPAAPTDTVMTEADVNQRVQEALAGRADLPVKNLRLVLKARNQVGITGRAQVAGQEAEVTGNIVLKSANGLLDVEVQSVQAGPIPLPSQVTQPLIQQALRAAGLGGLAGNRLPDGVDRVEVRPGELVLIRK